MKPSNRINYDGELYLYSSFLSSSEASHYFSLLLSALAWKEETIKIYGKQVKVPRLVCWYGDVDAHYRYSGIDHEPLPWTQELAELRDKISTYTGYDFNSVLANLYRNQNDSMGWHSDKEKELGEKPTIASLSLGETRLFKLQHKKTKEIIDVELQSGDLLMMEGNIQQYWRHSLPKSKIKLSARINLTFRRINVNS